LWSLAAKVLALPVAATSPTADEPGTPAAAVGWTWSARAGKVAVPAAASVPMPSVVAGATEVRPGVPCWWSSRAKEPRVPTALAVPYEVPAWTVVAGVPPGDGCQAPLPEPSVSVQT